MEYLELNSDLKIFKNFDEAASNILQIMSRFIDVNTLFIAKNDKNTNEIVRVLNKENILLEEGETTPFNDTFCRLSIESGPKVLVISDITTNDLTKSLEVTKKLGSGCFIGIPIYFGDGENYGTICGLDTRSFQFEREHIELFETMASLLSYVLDLDDANRQIQQLSAPFVPLTKGVAILPIIGLIRKETAENIILLALTKSQQYSLQYLIIDLSGISQINNLVSSYLLKIVDLLGLIGVKPILTGLSPETAMKAIESNINFKDITIEATLERALKKIGFKLNKIER